MGRSLSNMALSFLFAGACGGSPHRDAKVRSGSFGQKIERTTVRIAELARNVKPQPGSTRTRREKRLEDLRAQIADDPRTIVVQFADHGIAHIPGTRDDAYAAVGFAAMLPRVDHH